MPTGSGTITTLRSRRNSGLESSHLSPLFKVKCLSRHCNFLAPLADVVCLSERVVGDAPKRAANRPKNPSFGGCLKRLSCEVPLWEDARGEAPSI